MPIFDLLYIFYNLILILLVILLVIIITLEALTKGKELLVFIRNEENGNICAFIFNLLSILFLFIIYLSCLFDIYYTYFSFSR